MDAEDQIRWIGPAHPDELGLAFDDGLALVPALEREGIVFTPEAVRALREIDERLTAMSVLESAELWTEAAIRSDRRWADLRRLALEALRLLPRP